MKEKLSNLLLDIGKYVITVVIISSIFSNFAPASRKMFLCASIITAAVLVGGGLLVAYLDGKTKKRKE